MADGVATKLFSGTKVSVSSAGSSPKGVHPLSIKTLKSYGYPVDHLQSISVDQIDLNTIDLVVTLCAEEVCPVVGESVKMLHWPLPDPDKKGVSDQELEQCFSGTLKVIEEKLAALKTEILRES
jgi:arsenate reductase